MAHPVTQFWHGADYNYEQWLDSPDVLDQDFAAMKVAGCNVMTVGVFSWSTYQPRDGEWHFEWMDELLDRLHANGLKAILATPSGSKPAWLSKAHPEVCQVDAGGHRQHHHARQNHCRTSPEYRRRVVDINTRLATRYAHHPALALWHVSNEYGAGRCYCSYCLEAFRAWLRRRYGSLEALNAAWWTTFWSHRFSAWDEIYPADPSLNGMMLDWARFTSDQTIDFYRAEIEPLRRLTPHVPVTTNFHGLEVGLDYHAFAREVDVVACDVYPRWHSEPVDVAAARTAFLYAQFRADRKTFLLMECSPSQTNWQGTSPLKRPGLHELAALQAVAHGSDSVQYFQWRQSRGGEAKYHGAVLDHTGRTDARVFAEVARVGGALGELRWLAGAPSVNRAAVVYDYENSWAIDGAQLPRSLEKQYHGQCQAWHAALGRLAVGTDVVSSTAPLGGYQLVVAPMLYLLKPGVADALAQWVAEGGTLVVTYLSGWVNEADLAHRGGAPGPLAPLLGLAVHETDCLTESCPQSIEYGGRSYEALHYADLLSVVDADVVATYEQDFYAGTPAVTRRSVGRGQAWYVAARLGSDFLEAFLADRCQDLGWSSPVSRPLPSGVEVVTRGAPPHQAVFALNWNAQDAHLHDAGGREWVLPPRSWRLLTAPRDRP